MIQLFQKVQKAGKSERKDGGKEGDGGARKAGREKGTKEGKGGGVSITSHLQMISFFPLVLPPLLFLLLLLFVVKPTWPEIYPLNTFLSVHCLVKYGHRVMQISRTLEGFLELLHLV